MQGPRVFISYAEEDGSDVAALATALRENGINAFFSRDSIDIGEEWLPRLKQEIKNADGMLFIVSNKSNSSKWLHAELGAAWILDKPIFPITSNVQMHDLHDILRSRQCFSIASEEQGKELISKIVTRLGGKKQTTGSISSMPAQGGTQSNRSVYDFFSEAIREGLLAVGDWNIKSVSDLLIGSGINSYLISDAEFVPSFEVSTEIKFDKFPTDIPNNSGIIFGWRSPNARPRYYNFLMNQSHMWLELIGSRGGDAWEDFIHVGDKDEFSITEGESYAIKLTVHKREMAATITRDDRCWNYKASIRDSPGGYVGLRPWRARVTCSSYQIRKL